MTLAEKEERAGTQTPKEASGQPRPDLVVTGTFTLGRLSEDHLLALAAAAPAVGDDPVAAALAKASAAAGGSGTTLTHPQEDLTDSGQTGPGYRLTTVRQRAYDTDTDLQVMCGEPGSVLSAARVGRDDRAMLKRTAALIARRRGYPLAVAVAPISADGSSGTFQVEGLVALAPEQGAGAEPASALEPADYARVGVWSAPLRIQHWLNLALIVILTATGYYIMDPFFGPVARDGESAGFLMGWIRFIHFTAAFAWVVVAITRAVSLFTSRNRYVRWRALWPLWSRAELRNLGAVAKHYAFVARTEPLYLAHNPLQQLAYSGVYVLALLQVLTGFALFGLYHQGNAFWALASMPVHWIGVPMTRLLHTGIMFLLWAFVILHVYLVFRSDSVERHGNLSAMIGGGVWVRRGAQPKDAPEVR
ncbi:MAG: Ni/Fe-hydrogenase, b-type cytochrome subunit [Nostocoides sp.]